MPQNATKKRNPSRRGMKESRKRTHLEALPYESVRGKVFHPVFFIVLDAHFPLRHYHVSRISHNHDRPGIGSTHARSRNQEEAKGETSRGRTSAMAGVAAPTRPEAPNTRWSYIFTEKSVHR